MPDRGAGSVPWSRRAVLLAGGLLVAGCASRERPVIRSEDLDPDKPSERRLREILERRAKALRDGNEQAYLADLDQANRRLIQNEKLVFANLRQFDLAELRYITSGTTEQPDGKGGVTFAPVVRVTRLTSDAGPGGISPAESFVYRLAVKDGRPVVTDIIPVTTENRDKYAVLTPPADAPWNTDELRVLQVSGKVWLAADRSVTDLDRYASVTEQELKLIKGLWGDRLTHPGYVLFLTRDPGNFKQWFGLGGEERFNPKNLGYQVSLLGVNKEGVVHRGEYAAARITVNLNNHAATGASPRLTIRHELAHAVTARARMTHMDDWGPPTWAIEGFARYTEIIGSPVTADLIHRTVAQGVREGRFRGLPPESKTFYGQDISFNYCVSATVFELAERLKGREAAVELYARIIERPDGGKSFMDLPIFDRFCQDIFGMSGGAFQSRWAGFVRNGA